MQDESSGKPSATGGQAGLSMTSGSVSSRQLGQPHSPGNELNASLHAATVMSLRAGDKKPCKLCREPDHTDSQCALALLQFPQPQPHQPLSSMSPPAGKRVARPETLERICSSWNKGRCAFPGSCRFRHVCASCRCKGHRARDCDETRADSPYKTMPQHTLADKSVQETPQR